MPKPITATLFLVFFTTIVSAQKKDTTIYYLKDLGKLVKTRDSCDYFVVITPPLTHANKRLFGVKQYTRTGTLMFMGGIDPGKMAPTYEGGKGYFWVVLQGPYTSFFPNGSKNMVCNYDNGNWVGEVTTYYPNGKLYQIKSVLPREPIFFRQCNDTAGKVIAKNGKGKWIDYNKGFETIRAMGVVDSGMWQGSWRGSINDSVDWVCVFKNNKILSKKSVEKSGLEHPFADDQTAPQFPGGFDSLFATISRNLEYPIQALKNRTQGRVILQFMIDKNGAISNIAVARGIGDGCDEEAVRVLKLCQSWKPGLKYGMPSSVQYNVPVTFSLTK